MNLLMFLTMGPPLVLMYMIYKEDRIEHEPVGLLARIFVLGMLSCIPAGIIESILISVLDGIMPESNMLYLLIENFLIVGMAEEGVKFVVTKSQTWNNKAFDYRFDGIVYAAVAALGFAFFENIFYVFGDQSMFYVAGMRAITSIPGHCTFGIMMGYYYGQAKYAEKRGNHVECRRNLKLAYLIPLLLHGFYDFVLSTGYEILFLVFIVYVIWLDVRAFRKVKEASRNDMPLQNDPYGGNPYQQFPNQQYPNQQFPNQQYPNQQYQDRQDPWNRR